MERASRRTLLGMDRCTPLGKDNVSFDVRATRKRDEDKDEEDLPKNIAWEQTGAMEVGGLVSPSGGF